MERVLRAAETCRRVGISRQTLWTWSRKGLFPPSRKIGPNTIGWLESELDQWIRERAIAIGPNNVEAGDVGAGR